MQHDPQTRQRPGATGRRFELRDGCSSPDSSDVARPAQQADRTMAVHLEPIVADAPRMVPFGREVASLIAAGRRLNVFAFAGRDGWTQAKARRDGAGEGSCVVLPWGDSPRSYRWPRCPHGITCDARGRSYAEALEIGRCIVSAGTPLVFVIGEGFGFPVTSPSWRSPLADRAEAA